MDAYLSEITMQVTFKEFKPMTPSNLPGVTASMFAHSSRAHGAHHVNRVICLGQFLVLYLDKFRDQPLLAKRWALPLWAATTAHDLARRDDGDCEIHGQWAVEENLPQLTPFFIENGVLKKDIPAIATAVRWHSLPTELSQNHPHWTLTALLKDADALDRIRLGEDDTTDPNYLRFPHSADLISLAERFYHRCERIYEDTGIHPADNIRTLWPILEVDEGIASNLCYSSIVSTPEILYHASPDYFSTFDTCCEGAHFGTFDQAHNVTGKGIKYLYTVQLSIKNPLRLIDLGTWSFNGIHAYLSRESIITDAEVEQVWSAWQCTDDLGWAKMKEILGLHGYDGFAYENEQEGPGDSFVAFYPTQIKIIKVERL